MTDSSEKLPDDARWAAITARDKGADGRFVYAVRTTGIFCRPSCASRQPKRENVRVLPDPASAVAAGYRPCRRCHPQRDAASATPLMQAMADWIAAHAEETLPLARLADEAGMSPSHFQRRFTAELGVSPRDYQAAVRMRLLKGRLRQGEDVLSATFAAGYGSTSRVYSQVDGGLGMTPSAYRAGGAGETIGWAVRDTALGRLLMAATARGVCMVQFGETADMLLGQLRAEYPKATLVPAGAEAQAPLDAWMSALSAHLEGFAPRPDLPLDLRGTAFQIRVWRFLLSIPNGDIVSYAELADGIGSPAAVRAAASACGANRIAVLIPCHRVLRSDGALGGYRWGLARKRALLDRERAGRSMGPPGEQARSGAGQP
jgi:AraC family transcriptional regulator of adaptative response/methylated-DNA-[protein]-cysteine methyltransferase